jgi:hypothetical protein
VPELPDKVRLTLKIGDVNVVIPTALLNGRSPAKVKRVLAKVLDSVSNEFTKTFSNARFEWQKLKREKKR